MSYMIPSAAGNPRWSNAEHTTIDLIVCFPHLSGEVVPYTAQKDGGGYSGEIFERASAGEFGSVAQFVEPLPLPPMSITRAQYGREMRGRGLFSQVDAVAFVTSTGIPAALQVIIDTIEDQDERDDVELLVLGAAHIERSHPLTVLMASGMGWSADDTDDFFRAAGAR